MQKKIASLLVQHIDIVEKCYACYAVNVHCTAEHTTQVWHRWHQVGHYLLINDIVLEEDDWGVM